MATLGQRVKDRRKALKLSQGELARRVEMKQQSIVSIEAGDVARPKKLLELARALKTSEVWLLRGEGPEEVYGDLRYVEPEDEAASTALSTAPRMAESRVDDASRRDVGDVPADAILEADLRVGLGGGGVSIVTAMPGEDGNTYAAEGVRDWFRLPEHVVSGMFRAPAKRIRCFEAVGDSMHPTVLDGDMVFVDVGHRVPSPPGIYALADVLGGVVLKRLEISSGRARDEHDPIEVRIISDNPKHSPEVKTLDEIAIVGRYLGRLTTF